MALVGRTIFVRGEVHSKEDLVIEGRVEGPVWCDGSILTLAPGASIKGEVVARVANVSGALEGTIVASARVDLRQSAHVTGRILATEFILEDGAFFTGVVQPQHLDAALSVARHRRPESQDTAPPR
jgi:cytoskeletal protein CcmA (bactofilin family)